MAVAEGVKLVVDYKASNSKEEKKELVKDGAKLGVETALPILTGSSVVAPFANILINNSRYGDVVTNPKNLDRAAGAYSQSYDQRNRVVNGFVKMREHEHTTGHFCTRCVF